MTNRNRPQRARAGTEMSISHSVCSFYSDNSDESGRGPDKVRRHLEHVNHTLSSAP